MGSWSVRPLVEITEREEGILARWDSRWAALDEGILLAVEDLGDECDCREALRVN